MSAAGDFERPVELRVTCGNLRHKMMYVDARQGTPGMVDDSSDTRIFWCRRTQESLGPDDLPVSPTRCTSERGCYCGG